MIKTIVRGDHLTYALARQQRWVDEHEDRETLRDHRQFVAEQTQTLRAENRVLRGRLRMAKARLRPSTDPPGGGLRGDPVVDGGASDRPRDTASSSSSDPSSSRSR